MKNFFVVTLLFFSAVQINGAGQPQDGQRPCTSRDLDERFREYQNRRGSVIISNEPLCTLQELEDQLKNSFVHEAKLLKAGSCMQGSISTSYWRLGKVKLSNILQNSGQNVSAKLGKNIIINTIRFEFPIGWEERFRETGMAAAVSFSGTRKLPYITYTMKEQVQNEGGNEKGSLSQRAATIKDQKMLKERAASHDETSHAAAVAARLRLPTITISSHSLPSTPAQVPRSSAQTASLAVAHATPKTPGAPSAPPNTPSALGSGTPVPTPLRIGALTIFSPTSVTSSGSNP